MWRLTVSLGLLCLMSIDLSSNEPRAGLTASDHLPSGSDLFEASFDCVKVLKADGTLHRINGQGLKLMEIDDFSRFAGQAWSAWWPPADRARVEQALSEARAGQLSRFSGYCPTTKGAAKWWDVTVRPMRNDGVQVEWLLAVSRDATAQIAIQQSLSVSEQRFRALADNIAQFAWMANPAGEVFWYNQRWFDYTGTTLQEVGGWGWQQCQHPNHVDRVVANYRARISSGEPWEDTFPLRAADGTYHWFLSRAMPVKNGSGQIALWCGTNTDISEQRATQARLAQKARAIEMSHEAIMMWSFESGLRTWNRGCEELYGYSKAEALGRRTHELLRTHHQVSASEFEAQLLAQKSWTGPLQHNSKSGEIVWVDSRQEVIDVGGQIIVLETNRDITERRKADAIRDMLISELNHRVKNTLAVVQSIARQSGRYAASTSAFIEEFNGRLQALSRVDNILTDANWSGAGLLEVIHAQITIEGDAGDRVTLSGPNVHLPPQSAVQLSLILHELTINARKHGALSQVSGRVDVNWDVLPGEPTVLALVWRESGGPAVQAPASRKYGTTFIDRSGSLSYLRTRMVFAPLGLQCEIELELRSEVLEQPATTLGSAGTAST